jgi:hypothetical protein
LRNAENACGRNLALRIERPRARLCPIMAWKRDPVPWAGHKLTLKQKALALLTSIVILFTVFILGFFAARFIAVLILRWRGMP